MIYYWSAFALGLFGSLHCLGMCAPLMTAIYGQSSTLRMASYHLGRIGVYILLGILFGLIGRGLYLADLQRWFSFVVAFMFLGLGVYPSLFSKLEQWFATHFVSLLSRSKAKQKNTFIWGAVNGLLPCGMVYTAVATAINSTSMVEATGFMALFGLGTLPLLLALFFLGKRIVLPHSKLIQRVFFILVGLLFLLRALAIGGMWSPDDSILYLLADPALCVPPVVG